MDVLPLCKSIGDELRRQYNVGHNDVREFGRIATDVLSKYSGGVHFGPDDVAPLASSDELPSQGDIDSDFGEPALTVVSYPRFRLDILCWRNGTTAIHQHQFAGAFMVLHGSSVQTTYAFESRKNISESFQLGLLTHGESRTLMPGDVQRIDVGASFIHSVFHLDAPTITLVARTQNNVANGPQFRYEKPNVA